MTAGRRLPPVVWKEIRALLPAWSACLIALAAAAAADDPRMVAAGVFAYAFGSIGLGAQSMGHEYAHRTLGSADAAWLSSLGKPICLSGI